MLLESFFFLSLSDWMTFKGGVFLCNTEKMFKLILKYILLPFFCLWFYADFPTYEKKNKKNCYFFVSCFFIFPDVIEVMQSFFDLFVN